MMKKVLTVVAVMAFATAAAWANCGACCASDKAAAKTEAACKAGDTVYACAACNVCAPKAGACTKCKAELKAMHVLAVKDGTVSLCSCAADCKCTVKADDPKQCSCGKAIVTLNCKDACKAPAAEAK